MSPSERFGCLFLGLVTLACSLVGGGPAGAAPPAGPASPAAAATSSAGGALPAPQWVGGFDARGRAQLTWIRTQAFATVRVYRRDDAPQAPFRPLGETRDNAWLDGSVQPGQAYRYRLAGIGADGREGQPSAELVVRIGVVALRPPAPPDWEGHLMLADGIGLMWSERDGEDAIAWNIYRKAPPDPEFRLIGSSRVSRFHDLGLVPDRQYLYVLTALDSSFRETPFSRELPVTFTRAQEVPEPQRPGSVWRVRRTRLVSIVAGGGNLTFERPADVAVGPVSGRVYVTDSGRNLVFVFSPQGISHGTVGASPGGESGFKNLLGLGIDREENLYLVDAGTGVVQIISPQGRRVELPRRGAVATGLIDVAIGSNSRIFVIDNYNNQVSAVGREGAAQTFGQAGPGPGEFSAPTFCDVDAAGNLYVADCLNARVQVFARSGEFVRAFGRPGRGPGSFGRPKGVAVSAAGEVYVADSWLNTIQVFDAAGRFVAILGDEAGRPLDLGSPNGVALGRGNRVYVAERLAARLQIRELIDVP